MTDTAARRPRSTPGWRRGLAWSVAGIAGAVLLTPLLPGCAAGYVARQSASHLRVLAARQPVDRAVADGRIPPQWLPSLETIEAARRFGAEDLGLPTGRIYRSISLVRPGPMWVVTAAPVDALEPVTWWFPVAGRVAYRGYYDREDADRFAARLRQQGRDVLVQASGAFSSLGWFADPIRPSMLERSEAGLVDLVLHEAAHGLLYIKGHTDFNEAFATFVGNEGRHAYFRQREGEDCATCRQLDDAADDAATFARLVEDLVAELEALYSGPLTTAAKLSAREELFTAARLRSRQLEWRSDDYHWFADAHLDNAVVLSLRRYGGGQQPFLQLLARCDNDLGRTLEALSRRFPWRQLPASRRRQTTPSHFLRQLLVERPGCLEDTPADGT